MKYELMIKHVLQLDGTSVIIVGIINSLRMTLHACPCCTVTQAISIVELPTHFSICLSRDFTTQIGGYIAPDWSFLFFKTRYGTKTSIRVRPLVLDHIEAYIPSPINVDYTSHEEDEGYTFHEHATPLAEVPNYILDEWANAFQFDPMLEVEETRLGTYCSFEKDAHIPNLIKKKESLDGL